METAVLMKPDVAYKKAYMSFYHEWKASGEKMIPWVIAKDPAYFEKMVQELLDAEKGIGLKKGYVPDSTYWLMHQEKVIGVVNIRHELSEILRNSGGHIGYGIRPSERQKGYAKLLLKLSLQEIKKLGVQRALVVCDDWNTASRRTILANGGIQDEDYIEENGAVVQRFWIHTDKMA
ncbi:GNAT family N-acetyltransferase [Priestia megaterium]|uniref:GNAT family N-acetyltransferase n=1 Tax=Priestia megaterium TaxID=1404 RepID=UPI0036DB33DC